MTCQHHEEKKESSNGQQSCSTTRLHQAASLLNLRLRSANTNKGSVVNHALQMGRINSSSLGTRREGSGLTLGKTLTAGIVWVTKKTPGYSQKTWNYHLGETEGSLGLCLAQEIWKWIKSFSFLGHWYRWPARVAASRGLGREEGLQQGGLLIQPRQQPHGQLPTAAWEQPPRRPGSRRGLR